MHSIDPPFLKLNCPVLSAKQNKPSMSVSLKMASNERWYISTQLINRVTQKLPNVSCDPNCTFVLTFKVVYSSVSVGGKIDI